MNIVRSICNRIQGVQNDWKSRYWEYAQYYNDGLLWEDTVLFESFGGKNFQGNPYFLYKALFADAGYKQLQLVIAHQDPQQLENWLRSRQLWDERTRIVRPHTRQYRETLSHAKYLVNNVSFNMDYIKKPGQVYLNTWHGTPLKCLGRNIRNDPFECNNAQRNFLLSDYLVAPNDLTKRVYEEDYMVRDILPGEILLHGYPRNAVFCNETQRQQVRRQYGLTDKKTVFYMPTWRGTACGTDDVDQISQIEQLAEDLGPDYRVYVKLHPAMQQQNRPYRYCQEPPRELEVYEFLNAVDILITDYSSVFFDFANTGKSVVLYQYDREDYFRQRGIYAEAEKNIPFPVAYTYAELLEQVRNAKPGRDSAFTQRFCRYDSIDGADTLLQTLFSQPQGQKSRPVDLYVIDFPVTGELLLQWKEQLTGQNYRFVFVLNGKNRQTAKLDCFDRLEYLMAYPFDRLTSAERIAYGICRGLSGVSKKARSVCERYCRREIRRLWGDMEVANVYAKGGDLPVSLAALAKKWPL